MKADIEKELPIGIQDFPSMITGNYIYVDKTEDYHRLIQKGKYYFLSRPRRFGKSLMISTLKAIFEGRRELFAGLWIEDKMDWEPRPVILLDFSRIQNRSADLEEAIRLELMDIAANLGVNLTEGTNAGRLQQIIRSLGEQKVAILVDEYDKPIIDYIDAPERAEENRVIIKNLYSVLKPNDASIAFLMITGVSKFSQVSIFSDLNHLKDISISPDFSQMLGYTVDEISRCFPKHLQNLETKWAGVYPDVMAEMKDWYNGYSWDGEHYVYNPFSILNLFFDNQFGEYWFATGTPTFLMKLIRSRSYGVFDIQGSVMAIRSLSMFDVRQIGINALLFQTGYLTIKKYDPLAQVVTLDFPNREVTQAFSAHLLSEFAEKDDEKTNSLVWQLAGYLRLGDTAAFIKSLTALFAGISVPIQPAGETAIENYEKYYHTMFYLTLRLLGFDIQTEVYNHVGRIDAVIQTKDIIYVTEFKLGDAASAMAQIKAKGYHLGYLASGKRVLLLGIGFDVATRNIGDYVVEEVDF